MRAQSDVEGDGMAPACPTPAAPGSGVLPLGQPAAVQLATPDVQRADASAAERVAVVAAVNGAALAEYIDAMLVAF